MGISSALFVHGKTYVIDCGRGSVSQFAKAGLTFPSLSSIFITHLHSDHVADYYNYFLMGDGRRKEKSRSTARGGTSPMLSPFPVMEDENVKVSAILVPHYDAFPSLFGFTS